MSKQSFKFKGIAIDLKKYTVTVDEEEVALTAKELELLSFLLLTPNKYLRKRNYFATFGTVTI